MRTVYLGTSAFAAGILRALAASPHRPALVLTRPDRPRGRGRRVAAPPVAEVARELGLHLAQPDDVNDETARTQIGAAVPETVVVCAYGAIIREPLLSDHELLNVHPSLLPRWRGAAPVERAIMAGDTRTGVSIMRLTAGLDSGPVCLQSELAIGRHDTYGSLAARLESLGGELLIRALDERPVCNEQPEDGITYAEKISAADRLLDPDRPAAELARRVRALAPHIGAAVMLADQRLGVWEARATGAPGPQPGEVSFADELPVFGAGDGGLELISVQPAGRRAMSGADFLRGRRA